MRTFLFTFVVAAAVTACSLYRENESTRSLTGPDGGVVTCGGGGSGGTDAGGAPGTGSGASDGGLPCGDPDDGGVLLPDGGWGSGSGCDGGSGGGSGWGSGSGSGWGSGSGGLDAGAAPD